MMNGQSKNTRFRSNHAPQTPGLSYWESKGWFENTDALIVGGGLVGMNAALELQSLHPNWRIVLIDRSDIGGASTRNAGFACFGSPTELLEDWQILGREKTIDLVKEHLESFHPRGFNYQSSENKIVVEIQQDQSTSNESNYD